MKKTLLAVIIIFMLIYPVQAEQLLTRETFCAQLASALNLQSNSLFPLIRYNDWAQIDMEKRFLVAASIKNGIFSPDEMMLQPKKAVELADLDAAIFGIKRYIASNDTYSLYQGSIMAIENGIITVSTGAKEYKAKEDCLYFQNGVSSFAVLKSAQKIEFVINNEGKLLLGWDIKYKEKAMPTVMTGQLYLYHDDDESLIITDAKYYISGQWIKLSQDRYTTIKLNPSTPIVCEGKRIRIDQINRSFLDRQISLVMEEESDSQMVLYINIH